LDATLSQRPAKMAMKKKEGAQEGWRRPQRSAEDGGQAERYLEN